MSTLLSVTWRVAGAIFNTVYPKAVIESVDLGVACVEIAAGKNGKGWDKRTEQGWVPNPVLKELAEELKRAGVREPEPEPEHGHGHVHVHEHEPV
jgi:hypothetical protein